MQAQPGVSGVVLAGGLSRRLGRNKVIEPMGGEPLISRVIGRLSQVAASTVVVVNDRERAALLDLPGSCTAVVDTYPGKGSLGGILTGLSAIESEWAVVVAADMPFLSVDLLRRMLSVRDGYDAVVPRMDGRFEPTHAAYSVRCLPHVRRRVLADDLKIDGFFPDVRVKVLSQDEVEEHDPQRLSFFNVNTQQDLDRALALAAQGH